MRTPTRKILAPAHTKTATQAKPQTMLRATCHAAIGSLLAVTRSTMTKGIAGGMKLATVASMPLGCSLMGSHSMSGMVRTSIAGVTRLCASRRSFTALPTLAMMVATKAYDMMK